MERIAANFNCYAVEGSFSCNMRRFILEGEKVVLNLTNKEEPPMPFEVQLDDVFNVDIMISTAEGRLHEEGEKTSGGWTFPRFAFLFFLWQLERRRSFLPFSVGGNDPSSVFMRDLGVFHNLKSRISRTVYSEITARYPTMPFSIHQLQSPNHLFGLKVSAGAVDFAGEEIFLPRLGGRMYCWPAG